MLTAPGYREWTPPTALQRAVQCIWLGVAGDRASHVVLPDNCADILIALTPDGVWTGAWVVGTMTAPLMTDGSDPRLLGVRFQPGWLSPMLGIPGAALRDQRVPLDDLSPRLSERLRSACRGDVDVRSAVLRIVGRVMETSETPPAVVRLAWERILGSAGTARVEQLCGELGVTRQHLARRFDEALGISPKLASRVVRMQRVLARAKRVRRGEWARVAVEAGFSDQSHLIGELRALAWTSPAGLVE